MTLRYVIRPAGVNTSARFIHSLPPRVPTTYLIELHWPPTRQEWSLRFGCWLLKHLKFGEPKYLADLLTLQNVYVSMGLRTSDDPFQLEVPRATSECCFSERAFSYFAPHLLNGLPASLKEMDSIATSKI